LANTDFGGQTSTLPDPINSTTVLNFNYLPLFLASTVLARLKSLA